MCGEWKKKRKNMQGMEKSKKNTKNKTCGESYSTFPTRFRVLVIYIYIYIYIGMRKENIENMEKILIMLLNLIKLINF